MTWFRDCSQPTWCVGWRQKGRSQLRVPAASLVPVRVVNWKANLGKKRMGGVGQITSLISHHAIAQTAGPAGRRLGRGREKALGQQLALSCIPLMEDPHPGEKDGHLCCCFFSSCLNKLCLCSIFQDRGCSSEVFSTLEAGPALAGCRSARSTVSFPAYRSCSCQ